MKMLLKLFIHSQKGIRMKGAGICDNESHKCECDTSTLNNGSQRLHLNVIFFRKLLQIEFRHRIHKD